MKESVWERGQNRHTNFHIAKMFYKILPCGAVSPQQTNSRRNYRTATECGWFNMDYSLLLFPSSALFLYTFPRLLCGIHWAVQSNLEDGKKNRDRHTDKSKDVVSPLKRTKIRMYYIYTLKGFFRLTYNIYQPHLFPTDRLKKSGYYWSSLLFCWNRVNIFVLIQYVVNVLRP
jgi:hypothetical protein